MDTYGVESGVNGGTLFWFNNNININKNSKLPVKKNIKRNEKAK